MAASSSLGNVVGRWIFAAALVFGTYNPTQYSYISWAFDSETTMGPVIAIVGIVLLIGWIVFLRATFLSLGWLGISLGAALLGCLVWLLVDIGWLSLEGESAMTWVILLVLSLLLAFGLSWSHIRRRLTGQVDVDHIEDGRG
ncbi:hypothetical protein LPB19_16515 [Marinobacter salinisoli]|uniref:Uncharacterized protein n=1 Tax=Marinobacter salinisoli TaxID=2769486 RepID=A0ABX7MR09_9GAMM|nr:DUF6524 family protein [Marinobacter salinisoli]QSP94750.1 hypothetical protein LPB19_16515 [Marinobacter salinisoli]